MKEKNVVLAPKGLVLATWILMIVFAPIYFLRGGLIGGGIILLLPARLFENLRYFSDSALNAIDEGIFVVLGAWLIHFVVLYVGLQFRSWPAYRRWLILCVTIFLLTQAGFGSLAETIGLSF